MLKKHSLRLSTKLGIFSVIQAILFSSIHKAAYAQVTVPWIIKDEECVQRDVATIKGIECLAANILGIAISGIGLAAATMLVVGSILYLTSGGVPKGTEAAKKTITYAIIGLVVAISAWIILNFISVFTGNQAILKFGVQDVGK